MFKKENLIDAYVESRQKIGEVIADLGGKRMLVMQRKEKLQTAFNENLKRPLSKVATMELVGRVIDNLATDFRKGFTQEVGPSCMTSKVSTSYGSEPQERPLILDDVASILETGKQFFPDKLHGLHSSITWITPSPAFLCFFFGDTLKEKVLPLLESMEVPQLDDGQSLAQRELESQRLQDEIAKVDREIADLDTEIAKWQKVRGA